MITVDSPIVGNGGPLDVEIDITHVQRSNDVDAYFRELYRLCELVGFDYRILVAQSAHETANWTSSWWNQRLNPAGLGITGDAAQNNASQTWSNGTTAAGGHVAHMVAYVFGGDWIRVWEKTGLPMPPTPLDHRFSTVAAAGFAGTVHKLGDLGNGKWATDPNYAQQIAAKANAIFKDQGGMNPVTTYQIVGLPGPGIELPVPLSHDIIALSQPNQRPGITRQTPGYWVQHETANTAAGADAAMHNRWLHNGADGSQLSFHFCVDDGAIYQMIPIDEVTWQAADGSGPGNMSGISCELCVNAGIDTAKARHNAEALAGGILKALGMDSDRVKRHWDFNAGDPNRHHCPDQMMSEGYWPTFVEHVGAIIGAQKPTNPTIPTVPWGKDAIGEHDLHGAKALAFLGQAETRRDVPVRAAAESNAPVIARIKRGEKVTIRGTVRTQKGRWAFLDLGAKGVGRVPLSALTGPWPVP